MSVATEDMAMPGSAVKAQPEDYFTHVAGVGYIPRDIYKHVKSNPLGDLPRYSVHIVIQHILIFTTFIVLAATGITLHYSDVFWAIYVISIFGGIDTAQFIHRSAAFVMIGTSVYHVLTIAGSTVIKISKKEFDIRRTQIPQLKDLYDLILDVKYFMSLVPYRPKMEKFMYKQKLHYLAILWGSFVLIFAGMALLVPEYIALFWPFDPAFVQDLARIMHADEAIMALIVVAFWHLSNVHLVPGRFPAQWTVFTGKITREHQLEEHFLEYLRNLSEIPEERAYMQSLLLELGYGEKEGDPNDRDPKRQEHPRSVYLIGIMVWLIILFVLGGVVNHLAFSSHGPGLLIPLVKKFQKKESPILKEFQQHQKAEEHRHFHHLDNYPETPEELKPVCFICHSTLPHSKIKKIRAMLNMHTNYFACETCHLEINEGETVVYKWYSPMEKNPNGPFFGTDYDSETGELEMVDDHFSKIAPFYKKDGILEPTLHMQQGAMARDYVKVRDQLTPEQRDGITKKFHVDIRSKGPECHTCHATNGILDFKKLGFSEKRIADLEYLSIKGMITKYDAFYLPDLFK